MCAHSNFLLVLELIALVTVLSFIHSAHSGFFMLCIHFFLSFARLAVIFE